MDEFTPYGKYFDEALDNLDKVLQRCREMNLSLSNEKCKMMMNEGILLGHHISSIGIEVDKIKIKTITLIPTPLKPKYIRSFLGHARYYRRFIKDFSKLSSPLFNLLSKDVYYCWTFNFQQAFKTIKEKLSTALVLQGPNWALLFHIHIDASDNSIGAVLGQDEEKKLYSICFISKKLVGAKLNYIVTENELLAVVHALIKFTHYVTRYKVFVHTDHVAIRYLMNKPDINGRMIRRFLLLQQFDLTILDNPSKQNVVADFLSRLITPIEEGMIDDPFLNEYLFSISTQTHWFSDITNYLTTGKFPQHFSYRERCKIIQKSSVYTWVAGYLFKLCRDKILRRCIREDEVHDILHAFHDESCGGNYSNFIRHACTHTHKHKT
jgi:hypothetical protein